MGRNNETGIIQPIDEIAGLLQESATFLHVDGAQGFGKDIQTLQNPRIDMISVSGHKIYGPKGVGALIARMRGYERPPLKPLMYGGGQERGLRSGTLPVPLVVGFGLAAEMALADYAKRQTSCKKFKEGVMSALSELKPEINGDPGRCLSNAINLSIPGVDSEAVMLALKGVAAISNGSACTSHEYKPSHVLKAMNLSEERIKGALRISWCHLTQKVDWDIITNKIESIR